MQNYDNYLRESNILANNNRKSRYTQRNTDNMKPSDQIFLQSILKRQYYLLRELYQLHDVYPDIIDIDTVSSLDCVFRVLDCISQSVQADRMTLNGRL